jgi:hypothetical protein
VRHAACSGRGRLVTGILAGLRAVRGRLPVRDMGIRRFLDVYRYNRSFETHRQLTGPVLLAARSAFRLAPRILFYPGPPPPSGAAIFKICLRRGYVMTTDVREPFDLVVKWHNTTFSPRDNTLAALAAQHHVLNVECEDISKTRVGEVFSAVFGYTSMVDPLTYRGDCVEKSDLNAAHDGRVVSCPVISRVEGAVYQRVIANRVGGGLVEDIRVPVFGALIPFAYLKYRPIGARFENTNTRAVLVEVRDVLAAAELELIMQFCRAMGLDYGELDILRDRGDGRIYVVDVNTTPFGPPNHIEENDGRIAVTKMVNAFGEAFLPRFHSMNRR